MYTACVCVCVCVFVCVCVCVCVCAHQGESAISHVVVIPPLRGQHALAMWVFFFWVANTLASSKRILQIYNLN